MDDNALLVFEMTERYGVEGLSALTSTCLLYASAFLMAFSCLGVYTLKAPPGMVTDRFSKGLSCMVE